MNHTNDDVFVSFSCSYPFFICFYPTYLNVFTFLEQFTRFLLVIFSRLVFLFTKAKLFLFSAAPWVLLSVMVSTVSIFPIKLLALLLVCQIFQTIFKLSFSRFPSPWSSPVWIRIAHENTEFQPLNQHHSHTYHLQFSIQFDCLLLNHRLHQVGVSSYAIVETWSGPGRIWSGFARKTKLGSPWSTCTSCGSSLSIRLDNNGRWLPVFEMRTKSDWEWNLLRVTSGSKWLAKQTRFFNADWHQ